MGEVADSFITAGPAVGRDCAQVPGDSRSLLAG